MGPTADWDAERRIVEAHAGAARIALIAESFARLTGGPLVPPGEAADALWRLPAVVVAHGTEADPVFFYANRAALALFEFPVVQFLTLPSRLSAERAGRAERAQLMDRVTRENFISDYAGVRVSASGRRFRIERATVWNLLDSEGAIGGQAACFEHWTPLDPSSVDCRKDDLVP